jgi:Ca2+/Na+ antiporter
MLLIHCNERILFLKKAGIWIGLGVAVIILIGVGFIVAATLYPDFRVISRDIAIVILAVFLMIATLLVIVLLLAILYAVKTVTKIAQEQVVPTINVLTTKVDEVLDNTRAITGNVRQSADAATTTTVFVAERVASPIIRVSSVVAGVRAAAISLAHRDNGKEADTQPEV